METFFALRWHSRRAMLQEQAHLRLLLLVLAAQGMPGLSRYPLLRSTAAGGLQCPAAALPPALLHQLEGVNLATANFTFRGGAFAGAQWNGRALHKSLDLGRRQAGMFS